MRCGEEKYEVWSVELVSGVIMDCRGRWERLSCWWSISMLTYTAVSSIIALFLLP